MIKNLIFNSGKFGFHASVIEFLYAQRLANPATYDDFLGSSCSEYILKQKG